MKSNAFGVGSANLKGKKTKRLRCGCCNAINFKEKHLKQIHKKRNAKCLRSPMGRGDCLKSGLGVGSNLTEGTNIYEHI